MLRTQALFPIFCDLVRRNSSTAEYVDSGCIGGSVSIKIQDLYNLGNLEHTIKSFSFLIMNLPPWNIANKTLIVIKWSGMVMA